MNQRDFCSLRSKNPGESLTGKISPQGEAIPPFSPPRSGCGRWWSLPLHSNSCELWLQAHPASGGKLLSSSAAQVWALTSSTEEMGMPKLPGDGSSPSPVVKSHVLRLQERQSSWQPSGFQGQTSLETQPWPLQPGTPQGRQLQAVSSQSPKRKWMGTTGSRLPLFPWEDTLKALILGINPGHIILYPFITEVREVSAYHPPEGDVLQITANTVISRWCLSTAYPSSIRLPK